jgi:hypothetical protein
LPLLPQWVEDRSVPASSTVPGTWLGIRMWPIWESILFDTMSNRAGLL